jgi:hypothetical protein
MGKEKTGGQTGDRGRRLFKNVLNEIVQLRGKCIHTNIPRPMNISA